MSPLVVRTGPAEGVATLTLDRPDRRNALSIALRHELCDHLDALRDDEDLRVLVLAATGDVFCAGFDLGEFGEPDVWPSSDRYHHALLRFPLPTVAAVGGPALGGGFDLAVLCDVRVAGRSAVFGHPEQAFGDVVYGPLHDLVGGAVARDLCFTGRRVDAEEALRVGLVSRVVDDADVLDAALAVAADIAKGPRASLVRTKAKALARLGIPADTPTLDL